MDITKILTRREIKAILDDLQMKRRGSDWAFQALAIFRFSCCCGLRVSEISGLNVADLKILSERPHIKVRAVITKGPVRRSRIVPLWWDTGTLYDLRDWGAYRVDHGASPLDPLMCGMSRRKLGQRLNRRALAKRWKVAIKCLGPERVSQLSIHCGRHSFCSHAIAVGRSLVDVMSAVGHKSLNTTSTYAHLVERDNVPDLYPFCPAIEPHQPGQPMLDWRRNMQKWVK